MFKIRSEQATALEEAWRASFHRRLTELYRVRLPDQTSPMDDATLMSHVAEADRRALGHGIRTERGVTQFVGLSLVLGPRFDEHPRVREYLAPNGRDQDHKMDLLVDFLAEIESRHAESGP